MTLQTATFRYARSLRLLMYAGSLFFILAGAFTISQEPYGGLFLLALAALCAWLSFEASSTAVVSEDGIEYKKPFVAGKFVRWRDITRIKENGLMSRLELQVVGGGTLQVSTQLDGFNIILEILCLRRPDLFASHGRTRFQRKTLIVYMTMALGALFFGSAFLLGGGNDQWVRLVVAGMGLLCPASLLFEFRELSITEGHLLLKYPFREKRIPRDDVAEIALEQVSGGYGARSSIIALYLSNGKRITLGGFREGDVNVYHALQAWLGVSR